MNAVVDRVVQYPHRYQLKNINTGEVLGTFDLEPITGTISVVGTKIDKELFDSIASDISARLVSNGGDLKDTIITFSMASTRSNVASGEKLSVSFGKIAKYFNDLKAIAFSGDKADIGLGNVDNTSDANKPVSNATQQALNLKANKSDVYTKTETDGLLNDKANANDVYTKTKTDELLNNKANKNDVYTKSESDGLLNDKANSSDVYTKSESDTGLNKSLYNLGAYDTISGNVITRQTGYLTINAEDITSGTSISGGSKEYYYSYKTSKATNIFIDYNKVIGISSNGYSVKNVDAYWIGRKIIGLIDNEVVIGFEAEKTQAEIQAMCPIYIQYKLATPYTEEIIEGQPLITLDQQGSQWLRDEWEKGINLFNNDGNISLNGIGLVVGKTYTLSTNENQFLIKISISEGSATSLVEANNTNKVTFVWNGQENNVYFFNNDYTTKKLTDYQIMLNEGDHPYPYQAYNGEIVHDKDIADLYKQEYNLGYYDTMVENSDGTYTITRQTGYVDLGSLSWSEVDTNCWKSVVSNFPNIYTSGKVIVGEKYKSASINDYEGFIALGVGYIGMLSTYEYIICMSNGKPTGLAQYKLATSYTEKVEKNHYATYNQKFILEHNKSEAERSANLFDDNGTNSIQYIGHFFISSSYNLSTQNDYNCFRIRVEQNKTYYIKQIDELILRYEDINNNVLGGNSNFYQSGYGSFTTPNGCYYVVFSKAISYTTNATMLNEGSVALPYQPYEGKVVHEKELESASVFTKIGNKTNFSFDSGSYLVVANNGLVTVTGTDPLNVGSSANKKYLGIFMITIAEYDGGQSLRVNTEQVFFADYVSGTISGPTFTIYKLN